MENIEYSLINDGFCILPKIFSSKIIELAKEGLWDVIQGNYETGVPPENRFWNKGDDPKKIIKIDKPHLCNNNIRRLITNFDFGFNIKTDPILFSKDVNYIGSISTNQGKNDPVINIDFLELEGMNNFKRQNGLKSINFVKNNKFFFNKNNNIYT